MYISKERILMGLVVACYILSSIFEFARAYLLSYYLDFLIVPILTLTYIITVKKRNKLFLCFLLLFCLGNLVVFITASHRRATGYIIPNNLDYFLSNTIIVVSYIFLAIKIYNSFSFRYVFKHLKIHFSLLLLLNIYIIYVLQIMIKGNEFIDTSYYFELIYNLSTLVLLSLSALNYFQNDNQKALYLFLGILFLFFSESFDVTYLYIVKHRIFIFFGNTFYFGGFYFLYEQSKLLNEPQKSI